MLRVATAFGAAMVIALVASAAIGQGQNADGRFQLTAEDDGFLRLDTQTGALSYCQLRDGRWFCAPVETGDTPDLTAIVDRLAALEAAIEELTAQLAAPGDGEVEAQLAAIEAQLAALADQVMAPPAPIVDPGLAERLDALAADQAALGEAIAGLVARDDIADVAAVVTAIEERMVALEVAMGAAAEAPLARIGEELAALRDLNGDLALRLGAFLGDNDDIADAITTVAERLDAIDAAVAEARMQGDGALANVAAQLGELAERLTLQQGQIDALALAIDAGGESPLPEIFEAMAALGERQSAMAQQLAALTELIQTTPTLPATGIDDALTMLAERQTEVQSQLAALTEAIGTVETGFPPEIADRIAALVDGQTAIESQLVALTTAVEATTEVTTPPETTDVLAMIADDMAYLLDEMAALRAQVDALGERAEPAAPTANIDSDLLRIEAELLALREAIAALAAEAPPAVSDDTIVAPEATAVPPPADDPTADTTGFGEQLFLRLEMLVHDLRRGFGRE